MRKEETACGVLPHGGRVVTDDVAGGVGHRAARATFAKKKIRGRLFL